MKSHVNFSFEEYLINENIPSNRGASGLHDDDNIVAPNNSENGAYSILLLSSGTGEIFSSGFSIWIGSC